MPIATYSTSPLSAGFTQAQLGDAIRNALASTGWGSTFDDYSASGERNLVFRLIHDNTRTMGTVFIRIQISTSNAISATIMTGWNASNKVATNNATAYALQTFANTSPITIHTINAWPEFSGVILEQVGTFAPIMCLFPADRMAAWDLNIWPHSFLPVNNSFTTWRLPSNNPYGSSDWACSLGSSQMSSANRITNRRDAAMGILMFCPSSEGAGSRTSDEMGMGSVASLSRFNELVDDSFTPSRRHLILNAVAGGLTQRIA